MSKILKLGTRNSLLALWQANYVKNALENEGVEVELVPITSQGEKNLTSPLYSFGIQASLLKN